MTSFLHRYTRFVALFVTFAVVTPIAWSRFGAVPAILIGFDAGVLVFFVSLVSLFGGATAKSMRQRAEANEPDHALFLAMSLGVIAVTVAGVWAQFIAINALPDGQKGPLIGLATVSLLLAWLFANALGTIHYAHLWYLRGDDGKDARGLDFPGDDPNFWPDYGDFAYFAVVLSMTFQVSDVTITARNIRRMALAHGLVAFLFNVSVIALSVSLVTSALGK
jgi:uncharacterized membrane protein